MALYQSLNHTNLSVEPPFLFGRIGYKLYHITIFPLEPFADNHQLNWYKDECMFPFRPLEDFYSYIRRHRCNEIHRHFFRNPEKIACDVGKYATEFQLCFQ